MALKKNLPLWVLGFLCLSTGWAGAIDLYSLLALPDLPIAQRAPDWAKPVRKLTLSWTTEEMYREWRDGVELSRFDGSRSLAELEYHFGLKWGIHFGHQLHGKQIWKTSDKDKSSTFNLGLKEKNDSYGIRHFGKGWAVAIDGGSTRNSFNGVYELHPDIVAALGSNPGIHFENPAFSRRYRLYARGHHVAMQSELVDASYEHDLKTTGIRLALEVPLHRRSRTFATEWAYVRRPRWQPYIGWFHQKDHGNGVSIKNGRFEFGDTNQSVELNRRTIGVTRQGRRTWFIEYNRFRAQSSLYLMNNLITLDPLFLFGTNEIQSRIVIPNAEFHGGRAGVSFSCRWRIEGDIQYGFLRLPVTIDQVQTKISQLRTRTEETFETRDYRYDLHRLELALRRPDSRGSWKTRLRLMAPVERRIEKREAAGGGGGGGGGPAQPKPERKVRGGWQFTLEREFSL